ncbi:MAG: DUF6516 family protein, partial [Planctomycetota bacterium]
PYTKLLQGKCPTIIDTEGSRKEVSREKYRYQLMDSENKEIFRFDNASHHKSIASFPHHKHIDTSVYESPAPSLTDILREIEHRILGLSP